MKYVIFLISAVLSLLITAFSIILSPIIVLFSDEQGNLPTWLRYFQTFDATLDEGSNARKNELQNNPTETHWIGYYDTPTNFWQVYVNRLKWIVRNPAYGFDFFVFGKRWYESDWKVKTWKTDSSRDLFYAVSDNAFNFYYQGPLGTYKIGWKAWNHFDHVSEEFSRSFGAESGNFVPLCFTVNPFKHKTN